VVVVVFDIDIDTIGWPTRRGGGGGRAKALAFFFKTLSKPLWLARRRDNGSTPGGATVVGTRGAMFAIGVGLVVVVDFEVRG
jgi:hypothetical protein